MAGALLYLDSSALVKLVVPEPESRALRDALRSWSERVSSVVAEIEVERVARRIGGGAIRRGRSVLARLALVELDEDVVRSAAALEPPELRTLDAIHLATALSLGDDLGALCAYDTRLADAAAAAGVDVVVPASRAPRGVRVGGPSRTPTTAFRGGDAPLRPLGSAGWSLRARTARPRQQFGKLAPVRSPKTGTCGCLVAGTRFEPGTSGL